MDRGAWRAAAPEVSESDTTEHVVFRHSVAQLCSTL